MDTAALLFGLVAAVLAGAIIEVFFNKQVSKFKKLRSSFFWPLNRSENVQNYTDALTDIQNTITISDVQERESTTNVGDVSLTLGFSDNVREAVELVSDFVIPWRRENHEKIKELEAAQKELEKVIATQSSEVEQLEEKARQVRAKADKLELENQKMQLEIMGLALDMVKKVKPDATPQEQLLFAIKMLEPTRLIAMSPLEIVSVEEVEAEEDTPTTDDTETDAQPEDDETSQGEE